MLSTRDTPYVILEKSTFLSFSQGLLSLLNTIIFTKNNGTELRKNETNN